MRHVDLTAIDRKSTVLTPSQLPCLARVPTVNLTSGCAHGCLYCYGRSYSQYPGDGRVVLFQNTLRRLREELQRKRTKPPFVYFSPSTDVFQPLAAVLEMAYECFAFLLAQNIGIAFVTKGFIPPEHMALFRNHPTRVRAQIGLITLDASVLQTVEPGAAQPNIRLRQIEELIRMGVQTETRLDPILPGLTDDSDTLGRLFRALSSSGVKRIALNVLYLRPILFRTLREGIPDRQVSDRLLRRYTPGVTIRVCGDRFSQIALPKTEREEIYARAINLAKAYGIECHRCGCMNPDIASGNCNLTGTWTPELDTTDQLRLL